MKSLPEAVWLQKGHCTVRKERRDSHRQGLGGVLQRMNRKNIRNQLTILPNQTGSYCFTVWKDPHCNTQMPCTGIKAGYTNICPWTTPPQISVRPPAVHICPCYADMLLTLREKEFIKPFRSLLSQPPHQFPAEALVLLPPLAGWQEGCVASPG